MKRAMKGDIVEVVSGPWKGATGPVFGFFGDVAVGRLTSKPRCMPNSIPEVEIALVWLVDDNYKIIERGTYRKFLNKMLRKFNK